MKLADDPEFNMVEYFTPNHSDQFRSKIRTFLEFVSMGFFPDICFFTAFKESLDMLLCIKGQLTLLLIIKISVFY